MTPDEVREHELLDEVRALVPADWTFKWMEQPWDPAYAWVATTSAPKLHGLGERQGDFIYAFSAATKTEALEGLIGEVRRRRAATTEAHGTGYWVGQLMRWHSQGGDAAEAQRIVRELEAHYSHWLRGYNDGFAAGKANMEAKWLGNVTGQGPYAAYPPPSAGDKAEPHADGREKERAAELAEIFGDKAEAPPKPKRERIDRKNVVVDEGDEATW